MFLGLLKITGILVLSVLIKGVHSQDDLSHKLVELIRVDVVFKLKLVIVLKYLLVNGIWSNILNTLSVVYQLVMFFFLGIEEQLVFVGLNFFWSS